MQGVHLFRIFLDGPISDSSPILSAEEMARASRFSRDIDRRRFVAARMGLRRILARYTGGRPEELAFSYSARGRPSLASPGAPPLDFSLAHSGGIALLGVCRQRVGVDVEYLHRRLPDSMDIARSCYSAREIAALTRLPPEDRRRAFLTAWTRKEAVAKALGTGIAALGEVEVGVEPDGSPAMVSSPDGGEWRLFHLETDDGYLGAVAVESGVQHLSRMEWSAA